MDSGRSNIINNDGKYHRITIDKEKIKWSLKHEKCPGRIFNNSDCRVSKNRCNQNNCIFEYFKINKKSGSIDELFEI